MLRKLYRSLRGVFRKGKLERELEAELRDHLERETEANLQKGLSPRQARAQALRSFGGVEKFKEDCRDERGGRWLDDLRQDLHYGVWILRRNPGYALTAILTLALGIGANTAIFSVIYGVFLKPLPYQDGGRLMVLSQEAPLQGVNNIRLSVKEIEDYRAQSQSVAGLAEHHSMNFILYGGAEPERIQVGVVSANFFDVMGVKPLMGRTFEPADEKHGAEAALILSNGYWRRSQHSDPNIVGRVFRMNDRPHTVIGVLPAIPQHPNENDVYMPTVACPTRSSERFIANRNARMMSVYGRLKSGVSLPQAQAEATTIAGRLQQSYPESYPANRGYNAKLAPLQEELTRQARPTFLTLFGAAGLVLLIACSNVANLALARLMRREREMAVRSALGASRGRLIRQLLAESALVALIGGGLGVLLAAGALDLLVALAARFTPRAAEVQLDGAVLLFTFLISVLTGLIFGLAPALSVKTNLTTALKEGSGQTTAGATRGRIRSALVVAQVAVSFMLLIGAGLMLRSFYKLQQVDPGFDPEQVLVVPLSFNWSKHTTSEQFLHASKRILEKVKTEPGVILAAMASTYPLNPLGLSFGPFNQTFKIEGKPVAPNEIIPPADLRIVSPDYFQTIRLPLVAGRVLADQDHEKALQVAVINESTARHRWGDEDPLGQRITLDEGKTWTTIVGVVGDVKQYALDRAATDEIYTPMAQAGGASNLLVRTASDPLSMTRQLRRAIHEVDPEIAINQVNTLTQARSESLRPSRLTAILLGLFAALALVITAAGIAGVMALTVTQRAHEIGVRLALGATPGGALRMVLRQGLALVLIGLTIGSLAALVLARFISTLLFAVEPGDPLTFLTVSLTLLAAAAVACYLPARRVTSIDPMLALRSE